MREKSKVVTELWFPRITAINRLMDRMREKYGGRWNEVLDANELRTFFEKESDKELAGSILYHLYDNRQDVSVSVGYNGTPVRAPERAIDVYSLNLWRERYTKPKQLCRCPKVDMGRQYGEQL